LPWGRSKTLPVVEASGKPYAMGRMIGKKCRSKAIAYRKGIADSIKHSTGVEWPLAARKAKESTCPTLRSSTLISVEEIKGYAEGAGLPFEEMFALCCHELLSPLGFKGCTDMAVSGDVTQDGVVLAAHNEDWSSDALETVVLLHAKPAGKPEFFSTSYAGLLPSCGMNSSGISLTGNALSPNDTRLGIPKIFPVRKVLEARRIGEALESALPADRASSYTTSALTRTGRYTPSKARPPIAAGYMRSTGTSSIRTTT